MARSRSKTRRRRSPRTTSLINALEGYTYLSILTEGTLGTSPWGFVTGDTDLSSKMFQGNPQLGYSDAGMVVTGQNEISLGDLATAPQLAVAQIGQNAKDNFVPMAIQTAFTNIGFTLFKKGLRRPISRVNSQIMKPLGLGVRL